MEVIQDVFPYLHSDIRDALALCKNPDEITEIRLVLGKPVIIADRGRTQTLITPRGRPVIANRASFMHSVNALSGGSLYSIEENLKRCGMGEMILSELKIRNIDIKAGVKAIDDEFITHASISDLNEMYGYTPQKIAKEIERMLES